MKITSIRSFKTVTTVVTTALITTPSLYAEDDKNVLERYVTAGGWPMILIGLLILALVALCVFNFMNLTKQKFGPDDLKAGLMEHMINCRIR